MGLLNSGVFNRFACVGLLTITTVLAAEAKAAKGATCDGLFKSVSEKIQVPNTRRSIAKEPADTKVLAKVAVTAPQPRAKRPPTLPISAVASGEMATPFALSSDLKSDIRLLSALKDVDSAAEPMSKILGERRQLIDFLLEDDSQNIAVQSPFTVMNAAQRLLSLILIEGKQKIRMQVTGEEVIDYPFFSGGSDVVDGYQVVDAEKAIADFVGAVRAQSRKVRTGSSVPLLVGSGGTGKSELLTVLAKAMEKKTSETAPTYASYTFTWINLGEIPALHPYLVSQERNGKLEYQDIPAPLGDSPFTLFPKAVQKVIVDKASKSVGTLTAGQKPRPFEPADPLSYVVRDHIVQHYAKKVGHPLNALEIVEVLNHHVSVKRQIIGQSHGRMPLIDASSNDIDVPGLFVGPNPGNFFGIAGQSSPFSWNYGGKILTGHGNMVLFDEYLRNPKELIDMLLGAFESRRLSVNGAPVIPFDAVMIAASNTENFLEVEGGGTGKAALDRFGITPMRWSLLPNGVGRLAVLMNKADLFMQDLTVEDAPIVRGDIAKLFPRVQGSDQIVTPDYRYRVFLGEGSDRVEIAPHTLLLMAEIAVASRLHTDPVKAQRAIGDAQILSSNLLRSPIDRLRLLEGRMTATPEEIRELTEISELLKEGESGISARDVARWLEWSAIAARNGSRTVTPGILIHTLRQKLNSGGIKSPGLRKRLEWLSLSHEVVKDLLLPRLEKDIVDALANGSHAVKNAYFDMIDEMGAIYRDPQAQSYRSTQTKTEKVIDQKRMRAVKAIFQTRTGRELSTAEIAVFHQSQGLMGNIEPTPNEDLSSAISEYYAEVNLQAIGLQSVIEYDNSGIGSDDVKSVHHSLVSALKSMGYNEVSIRDALMLVQKLRNETQAAK